MSHVLQIGELVRVTFPFDDPWNGVLAWVVKHSEFCPPDPDDPEMDYDVKLKHPKLGSIGCCSDYLTRISSLQALAEVGRETDPE